MFFSKDTTNFFLCRCKKNKVFLPLPKVNNLVWYTSSKLCNKILCVIVSRDLVGWICNMRVEQIQITVGIRASFLTTSEGTFHWPIYFLFDFPLTGIIKDLIYQIILVHLLTDSCCILFAVSHCMRNFRLQQIFEVTLDRIVLVQNKAKQGKANYEKW